MPLIEAAKQHLPVLVRDLPVFREVAGNHAFYFEGFAPEDLADGVLKWLALRQNAHAPDSKNIPVLTWSQSAAQLVDKLVLKS